MKIACSWMLLLLWTAPACAGCWRPVATDSKVTYTATQSGAPMKGSFKSFDGQLCLDKAQPAQDEVRMQIQVASVDSGLPELDDALRGDDFFAAGRWPQASFHSADITALGDGRYQAHGSLTIRDVTHDITVPFTFEIKDAGHAHVQAQFSIRRSDYGVGQGEWADTAWVGDDVRLQLDMTLAPMTP